MKIYKLADSEYPLKQTSGLNLGETGHTSTFEVLQSISSSLPERVSSWSFANGTIGWFKFTDGIVYEVTVTPAARGQHIGLLKQELAEKPRASSEDPDVIEMEKLF